MRPTAGCLFKIRLLSQAEVKAKSIQLPPAVHQQALQQKKQVASSSVASRLSQAMSADEGKSWPGNLRIERAEKKTLFWKIPRERRTQLKRLLRES